MYRRRLFIDQTRTFFFLPFEICQQRSCRSNIENIEVINRRNFERVILLLKNFVDFSRTWKIQINIVERGNVENMKIPGLENRRPDTSIDPFLSYWIQEGRREMERFDSDRNKSTVFHRTNHLEGRADIA